MGSQGTCSEFRHLARTEEQETKGGAVAARDLLVEQGHGLQTCHLEQWLDGREYEIDWDLGVSAAYSVLR
jgi:hypothetical protein